jgi:transcription elongation GreA/GreB family factor
MNTKETFSGKALVKKRLLEAGMRKHQTVIDDFKQSINEMMQSDSVSDEKVFASSQQAFSKETIDHANRLAEQLQFATDEMKLLKNILTSIHNLHDTVRMGSVVVTDQDTFFVSASIERFEVDGLNVFGLSVKSPLYQAMEGKKAGDEFTFKKRNYRIKEVF